jgi:glycosyltransferase involved in cell wall biosynthesis
MKAVDAKPDFTDCSVVILMATFNDWESVVHLLVRLDEELEPLRIKGQVVVVDDGSTVTSGREKIASLSLTTLEVVQEVELTRNQGNQRALAVGIGYIAANLSADFLVVMDSDHEDDPRYIKQMLSACQSSGANRIIFAERTERSEGTIFRLLYWVYQRLFRLFTGMNMAIGNFSAVPWGLVVRLANIGELWNHYPAAVMRSRLLYTTIQSKRGKRLFGESKMTVVPLIAHAFGGFTVNAEFFAVRALLAAAMLAGAILVLVCGLVAQKLWTDVPIIGWTSVMVGLLVVVLFQITTMAGIILFLVLSIRIQTPMIPLQEYSRFVMAITRLYPAAAEGEPIVAGPPTDSPQAGC